MLQSPLKSTVEYRLTVRLMAYWEKLRRGRDMPAEGDLQLEHLKDLWDHCFLVQVGEGRSGFRYSHFGKNIQRAYMNGMLNDDPDRLVSPNAVAMAASFEEVTRSARPMIDEGEFRNHSNELVRYRQCLLPLGENGRVAAIVGGMRFRVFPAN